MDKDLLIVIKLKNGEIESSIKDSSKGMFYYSKILKEKIRTENLEYIAFVGYFGIGVDNMENEIIPYNIGKYSDFRQLLDSNDNVIFEILNQCTEKDFKIHWMTEKARDHIFKKEEKYKLSPMWCDRPEEAEMIFEVIEDRGDRVLSKVSGDNRPLAPTMVHNKNFIATILK